MIDVIITHVQAHGILGFIGGYLFGSIPFGLLLCLIFGYGDVRKIGSGNIGATNVLRTGNKLLAALTVLLDSSKGLISVLVAATLFDQHAMFGAALGAVVGHNFPVWLKFKGGKGVATTLGTFIALSWPVGLACCAVWLITAVVSRISSLSALMALGIAPVFVAWFGDSHQLYLIGLISMLGWVRHHANIKRLIKGEESKITFKKQREPS